MNKVIFRNDFYVSEEVEDFPCCITVLQDKIIPFGIDLTGCQFRVDPNGFINDLFTDVALKSISEYCLVNENVDIDTFKLQLRCKSLNGLLMYL